MRFGIREAIFLIVLLAVPVASFVYVFKPRSEQIHKANDEIATKTERLDRLEEVTARISDIDLAIEQGRQAIDQIEGKLPNERDVETVLEKIWNLASENGLAVRSVKSEKSVPAATYMELPLRMEMDGSFVGFYEFMLSLEGMDRITRVHHMTLERPDKGKISPNGGEYPEGWVKSEFTLSIYFQPQGSSLATAGSDN